MTDTARILIVISATVIGILGAAHMAFTFRGNRLTPRDADLTRRMNEVAPVISKETTMWRAWVGFNASHSLGALTYALVYGYLAIWQPQVLLGSWFLIGFGVALLGAYLWLAKRYWFSKPFIGIAISLVCFLAAMVLARWSI